MANSREALFQWNITKAMSAGGWEYSAGWNCPGGLRPTSVNDARYGKLQDPEKQRLAEIIDRINDLYCAKVSGDDKLHFAHEIADRIERNEAKR